MTWTPKTYGTAKAPAFESDCFRYDVVNKPDGLWRLVWVDDDEDQLKAKDFPTAEAAKAYAEAQA